MSGEIAYTPIGFVDSPITLPLPPDRIREVQARIVLEPAFIAALDGIAEGDPLWVIYHLHAARPYHEGDAEALFKRRGMFRPNAVGLSLVRVVRVQEGAVSVAGLDAIDGSPVIDLKPYHPHYDTPEGV